MKSHHACIIPLAIGMIAGAATPAHAAPSASLDPSTSFGQPSTGAPADAADQTTSSAALSRIQQVAKKGFIHYPSVQDPGAFRFALGAYYDAIDPAVMYGFNVRVPQLTIDARVGLGSGWSLKGHINTMLVTNELMLGASYGFHSGKWAGEATMSVGAYIGKLGQLGFDALLLSPEYRPEVAIGYELGDVALSLRGSLLLMGPERLSVGEAVGGLDNSNAFVGHSEMLYVENTTSSNSVWYFGLGAMTTRAYYALWVLFPDSPGLFTYPRIVAGYEF